MTRTAKIGTRAPDFSMRAVDGTGSQQRHVQLDDYLDQWLVLIFYSRDFTLI